jgi:DNA topoisomerase-1
MQPAQRLYEAGLITYMRTDSVNLSKDAMEAAQAEIIKSYGKEFSKPRTFVNKSKHKKHTRRLSHGYVPSYGRYRQRPRLYDLIWKERYFKMSDAIKRTNVKIQANNHDEIFTASGEVLLLKVS